MLFFFNSVIFSIIIWDSESFSPEVMYSAAHSHHVTCVRFIGCDLNSKGDANGTGTEILASTSLDGQCLLWDRRQPFPARSKTSFFKNIFIFLKMLHCGRKRKFENNLHVWIFTGLYRVKNTGLTTVEWLNNFNNQLIVGTETGHLMLIDTRNSKDVIYCSESFNRPIYRIRSCSRDSE